MTEPNPGSERRRAALGRLPTTSAPTAAGAAMILESLDTAPNRTILRF